MESKNRHSLSLFFIVSIGFVFIVLYAMQAFFLTTKISNTIRSDYEQNIKELTATHALALERKIKEYRSEIRMYTENDNVKYSDLETAAKWLHEAIQLKDKNYDQVLVADIDGNFISDDGKTRGSIRQYAFYDAIINKGEDKIIDDVIIDSSNVPVFHIARAIKNGKKTVGIIAITVKTDQLQKQVNKAKLGEHGYAWLMTADGTIISHPNSDWQLKKNFAKNPEPGFEDMTEMTKASLKSTDELVRQIKFAMEEQKNGSSLITKALASMNDRTMEVKTASNEMNEGNKTILEEVKGLQNITSSIKETMGQMKDSVGKVYDTSNQLSEISVQVQHSIERTGSQIDQFTV